MIEHTYAENSLADAQEKALVEMARRAKLSSVYAKGFAQWIIDGQQLEEYNHGLPDVRPGDEILSDKLVYVTSDGIVVNSRGLIVDPQPVDEDALAEMADSLEEEE